MSSLIKPSHALLGNRLGATESVAPDASSTGASVQIEHESHQSLVPYDENLLERSRTQWQFGDWEGLATLDRDELQHHPDRAKLALLAAAAHLQQGNGQAARQFTRLAQDWGCSKKLMSQVLISGVHNTLGRAAAIAGRQNQALGHFETAVVLGAQGSALQLIAQARTGQQLQQLGLLAGVGGPIKEVINTAPPKVAHVGTAVPEQAAPAESTFSPDAYEFYKGLANNNSDQSRPKFILLDSKSLPRSGLHYMKNTFARILGEDFSFCEWYQEPGCCRKMPCALKGYAQHCKKGQPARLRLIKSHDFALEDPPFEPVYCARRVILVRDPLYMLTSYFSLDHLMEYKPVLKKEGINMEKIWLSHESAVLTSAYQVLDQHFTPPTSTVLKNWVKEKSIYIKRFNEKWVTPAIENPQRFLHVVQYEDIDAFIDHILTDLDNHFALRKENHAQIFSQENKRQCTARADPFIGPSVKLTEFLQKNASIFLEAAATIQRS